MFEADSPLMKTSRNKMKMRPLNFMAGAAVDVIGYFSSSPIRWVKVCRFRHRSTPSNGRFCQHLVARMFTNVAPFTHSRTQPTGRDTQVKTSTRPGSFFFSCQKFRRNLRNFLGKLLSINQIVGSKVLSFHGRRRRTIHHRRRWSPRVPLHRIPEDIPPQFRKNTFSRRRNFRREGKLNDTPDQMLPSRVMRERVLIPTEKFRLAVAPGGRQMARWVALVGCTLSTRLDGHCSSRCTIPGPTERNCPPWSCCYLLQRVQGEGGGGGGQNVKQFFF